MRSLPHAAAMMAAAAVLTGIMIGGSARADDAAVISAFYAEVLSKTAAPDVKGAAERILAPNWESHGDHSGKGKTREQFIQQLGGFGKLIPDLKWEPQQVIRSGDTYAVRSRFTGTPQGPLFGVDGAGRSFDAMSIDIHEVKDGMIVKTYHVEDWSGVLRQLAKR